MPALALALTLLLTAAPLLAADDATVRVRILDRERPSQVQVRAEQAPMDLIVDGHHVLTLAAGSAARIERSGASVAVRALSAAETGRSVILRPHAGGHLTILAGTDARPYRGKLETLVDGGSLALVNVVTLEDYIASVIPSEYPFPEMEGVKAQAVLVRTYALKNRGRFGSYDLVDHVGSQVYRGAASETPLARQAADLTRGEVLTFGGDLIDAVYYSSSGGHTADNESIWDGRPQPYLRGRPDPYDVNSPLHRWTERVDRSRLLAALSRHYGFTVTGLSVEATSPEGRVTQIRLHGNRARVEQANRFRLTVNDLMRRNLLKSTFFTLELSGGTYVITGRGFGHGVGMSQYGAREQARQGRSYREILQFYYAGVTLERLSPGQRDVLLAASPPAGEATEMTPQPAHIPERLEPRPVRPVVSEISRERLRRTGW
jgi:stage II sporulation protein D